MSWVAIGAAAVGAAGSIYASNQASGAQKNAANSNNALQRDALNTQLRMYEPNRALGYGAASDLASLYGYSLPEYTSLNQLLSGSGGYGNGAGGYRGSAGGGGLDHAINPGKGIMNGDPTNAWDPAGIFSNSAPDYGGTIDPYMGTVSVNGHADRNALLTEYLRTGKFPDGVNPGPHNKVRGLIKQIDQLRASGWKYDPEASNFSPTKPSPTGQSGQAGNMSRFFTSPDYQFRLSEGQRDLGNSFAARGGAASGNALRALTSLNQNMASGEYGNYVSRLMQMAGLGQAATTNAAGASQTATNNMMQNNTAAGDARASGIMGAANGVSNAINSGMNWYMMNNYLNGAGGAAPAAVAPTYSQFGPYAGGYQGLPSGLQAAPRTWNRNNVIGNYLPGGG
jgi:hypothetical protein